MPALDSRDILITILLVALGLLALYILRDKVERKRRPPPPPTSSPPQTPPRIIGTKEFEADFKLQTTTVIERPRFGRLTRREREVAEQAARGLSNREIAGVLGMSVSTVQNHLRHIYEKLQITSRAELAWWWAQHSDDPA